MPPSEIKIDTSMSRPVCGDCGAGEGEHHADRCASLAVAMAGGRYVVRHASAVDLNAIQDRAVREVQQRDAEIERLRAELAAEQKKAREWWEVAKSSTAILVDVNAQQRDLRTAFDEQTRFLAGLDDRRWSKPDQERRRVLVAKAHELLRPAPPRLSMNVPGRDDVSGMEDVVADLNPAYLLKGRVDERGNGVE